MKKILSLVAVTGLLAVSASVPAQAETVEAVVAPAVVSVPADAPAPVVSLEAVKVVEAVEAPAVAVEPVVAPVPVAEPVAVPEVPVAVVEPVVAPEVPVFDEVVADTFSPAELGYVQAEDGSWQAEVPEEVPYAPIGDEMKHVVASDGALVFPEDLEAYEEDLRAGEVPVLFDPTENVQASDGSWVHPSILALYEAELEAGVEQAVAFGPTDMANMVPPGHTVEP